MNGKSLGIVIVIILVIVAVVIGLVVSGGDDEETTPAADTVQTEPADSGTSQDTTPEVNETPVNQLEAAVTALGCEATAASGANGYETYVCRFGTGDNEVIYNLLEINDMSEAANAKICDTIGESIGLVTLTGPGFRIRGQDPLTASSFSEVTPLLDAAGIATNAESC